MAQVVSPAEYRSARLSLLEKEKEATRARDALATERRKLPMVEVTPDYRFTGLDAHGTTKTLSLSDLFDGRRQLIMYHFMFGPDEDAGCSSCAMVADSLPPLEHLHSRSTSLVVVSRAPIEKLEAYRKRMGWKFPWVSSYESDFNYDMHTTLDEAVRPVEYNYRSKEELEHKGLPWFTKGEQPGSSVFYRGDGKTGEEGKVYHTYSSYARGGDWAITTLGWLDLTPLGRQDWESGAPGIGFHRRDEYSEKDLKGLH